MIETDLMVSICSIKTLSKESFLHETSTAVINCTNTTNSAFNNVPSNCFLNLPIKINFENNSGDESFIDYENIIISFIDLLPSTIKYIKFICDDAQIRLRYPSKTVKYDGALNYPHENQVLLIMKMFGSPIEVEKLIAEYRNAERNAIWRERLV